MRTKRHYLLTWVVLAGLLVGVAGADSFFDILVPEDWDMALYEKGQIQPVTEPEWFDYMGQWNMFLEEGDPYPSHQFSPAQLYVWEDPTPEYPTPGLVMMWDAPDDGSYSSAWEFSYDMDPDLSNSTIKITVVPPQFDPASGAQINVVSFGMRDINGNIRAWYWQVGPLPAPIPWNVPTTIVINTALVGVGATTPTASSYMNNPGFDITQVMSFIVDENAIWQTQTVPPPPPGMTIPDPWNLWRDLSVQPNPGSRLNVGINIDVHQDLNMGPGGGPGDPAFDPDDFHIEGRIESGLPVGVPGGGGWSDPPVLVDHVDDMFPNFKYSITPDLSEPGQNWYIITADWWGVPIPYCTVIHLGLKIDVVCHNVIIDLKGWWTQGGQPFQGGNNGGFVPIAGFNVQDNIAPPTVGPGAGPQYIRLQNGDNDGDPEPGEVEMQIVQMDLAPVGREFLHELLGENPLRELRHGGMQDALPYIPVHLNGLPISPSNPWDFPAESFFDVFFEVDVVPPPDKPYPRDSFTLNPGDYLVARQMVEFTNNSGQPDVVWFWELHEAHAFDADLGDAPDSTNSWNNAPMTAYPWGVPAHYPTVFAAGSPAHGPIHWFPHQVAYLGQNVTLEFEADLPPDQDPTTNIIPMNNQADLDLADDGIVRLPLKLPNCLPMTFDYRVNIINAAPVNNKLYFNAWLDFNRDGDWNDVHSCFVLGDTPEWIVQDQDISTSPVFPGGVLLPGMYKITTPQFLSWHPPGVGRRPIWLRITLSEQRWVGSSPSGAPPNEGGSGTAAGYQYGETEDYYFLPWKSCCVDCPDFNGDGVINLVDWAHFASFWLHYCT